MAIRNFFCSIFLFLVASLDAYASPSFDCQKATTRIEKAICNYPVLAELDSKLAESYSSILTGQTAENKEKIRAVQRAWLTERNKRCSEGGISEVRWCLQEAYETWLNWNKKQILSVQIDISDGKEISIFFNPDAKLRYSKDVLENQDQQDIESFTESISVRYQNSNKLLFKGENTVYSANDSYTDSVSSVQYFLTKEGDLFTALVRKKGIHGGRCDHYDETSLIFIGSNSYQKILGQFVYFAEDSACGTSYVIVNKVLTEKNKLTFIRPDNDSFYYQAKLSVNHTYTVNLKTEIIDEGEFLSTSVVDYFGTPYEEFFERVKEKVFLNRSPVVIADDKCSVPDYALSYYWELISVLSYEDVPASFEQIKFISEKVLRPEHLKDAKAFKPVIDGALEYLDQARKLPNWQSKLTSAAGEYPVIQANSNFYFSNDNTDKWITNPFIESGFSSNECFVGKVSPFGYADMEEWIYLFWARRVSDGNLENAEKILRKVSLFMQD